MANFNYTVSYVSDGATLTKPLDLGGTTWETTTTLRSVASTLSYLDTNTYMHGETYTVSTTLNVETTYGTDGNGYQLSIVPMLVGPEDSISFSSDDAYVYNETRTIHITGPSMGTISNTIRYSVYGGAKHYDYRISASSYEYSKSTNFLGSTFYAPMYLNNSYSSVSYVYSSSLRWRTTHTSSFITFYLNGLGTYYIGSISSSYSTWWSYLGSASGQFYITTGESVLNPPLVNGYAGINYEQKSIVSVNENTAVLYGLKWTVNSNFSSVNQGSSGTFYSNTALYNGTSYSTAEWTDSQSYSSTRTQLMATNNSTWSLASVTYVYYGNNSWPIYIDSYDVYSTIELQTTSVDAASILDSYSTTLTLSTSTGTLSYNNLLNAVGNFRSVDTTSYVLSSTSEEISISSRTNTIMRWHNTTFYQSFSTISESGTVTDLVSSSSTSSSSGTYSTVDVYSLTTTRDTIYEYSTSISGTYSTYREVTESKTYSSFSGYTETGSFTVEPEYTVSESSYHAFTSTSSMSTYCELSSSSRSTSRSYLPYGSTRSYSSEGNDSLMSITYTKDYYTSSFSTMSYTMSASLFNLFTTLITTTASNSSSSSEVISHTSKTTYIATASESTMSDGEISSVSSFDSSSLSLSLMQYRTGYSSLSSTIRYSGNWSKTTTSTLSQELEPVTSSTLGDTTTSSTYVYSSIDSLALTVRNDSTIYEASIEPISVSTYVSSSSVESSVTFSIKASSTIQLLKTTGETAGNLYRYETSYTGSITGNDLNTTSWINYAIKTTYATSLANSNSATFITAYSSRFGIPENYLTTASQVKSSFNVISSSSSTSVYSSRILISSSFTNEDALILRSVSSIQDESTFYRTTLSKPSFNVGVTSIITSVETSSNISTSSESFYNTTEYGETARLSDYGNSYASYYASYVVSYFPCTVSSIWYYNSVTSLLSEYDTLLVTTFNTVYSNDETTYSEETVSYGSTIKKARSTALDNRYVVCSEYLTSETYNNIVGYTVAYSSITISSAVVNTILESDTGSTYFTISTLTSSGDYETTSGIISSLTTTSYSGRFLSSSSLLVSSESEVQNESIVYRSTYETLSRVNVSYSTITKNTYSSGWAITNIGSLYNDTSYSTSWTQENVSTSTAFSLNTRTYTVTYSYSTTYTPIYSSVDGIFVTTSN